MKAIIVIDMNNAAFEEYHPFLALADVLTGICDDLNQGKHVETIRDINGNTCGTFRIAK